MATSPEIKNAKLRHAALCADICATILVLEGMQWVLPHWVKVFFASIKNSFEDIQAMIKAEKEKADFNEARSELANRLDRNRDSEHEDLSTAAKRARNAE
jgi:hypothetical protein